MRAAFLPRTGVVDVADFPVPQIVGEQILVQMQYASICGSDVHVVFNQMHTPALLGCPGYPGHEGTGVVVASRSPRFAEGTSVLTVPLPSAGGCFAEMQAIDVTQVVRLPADQDTRRLLLAQQLGTTIYAFRKFTREGRPVPRSAAIIGCGSAGLFFLQQLRRIGTGLLLVSDRNTARLATARRLGATVAVQAPNESIVDAVRDYTNGLGADLVIEAAGYDTCRAQAVEAVRDHGTIGLFGYPERRGTSPFPVERAFRKALSVEWISGTQREPGLRSFHDAVDAISDGLIEVDHCLERMFVLDQAATAMAAARDDGHGAAKIGFDLVGCAP